MNTATGNVTLTLYDVPADFSATATLDGSPVIVPIGTPGQNAQLTFAGAAGQRISVRGVNGTISGQITGCDVHVGVLNPDGTVFKPGTCMEASGFIDASPLAATGTYTVTIEPVSSATGNLTVRVYDVVDVGGSITAGGSAVTVSIAAPGQNAALTFSGTAGQRVSLRGTGRDDHRPDRL